MSSNASSTLGSLRLGVIVSPEPPHFAQSVLGPDDVIQLHTPGFPPSGFE